MTQGEKEIKLKKTPNKRKNVAIFKLLDILKIPKHIGRRLLLVERYLLTL
jgi:hypothetical protein